MPRQYIVNSWVGAAEYDEGDTYSGEQVGHRHQKSVGVHITRSGDQWRANIAAYADEEQKPIIKKRKSVADSIDLAQRHFDRIEQMSIDLDNEYFDGEIDQTRYELLRYKLDERLVKAWKRLEKENSPIWQKEDEKFLENSLTFSLDDVFCNQKGQTSLGNQTKNLFSRVKSDDKSLIKGKGCVSMALKDCSKNNVFLIGYCTIMNIVNKLKEGF